MARESAQAPALGAELRRLRAAAGLSTAALGELIQFSKGYISKVENGQKSPSTHFVRSADNALAADGRLIGLVNEHAGVEVDDADFDAASVAPGPLVVGQEENTSRVDGTVEDAEAEHLIDVFGSILKNLRDLGQILNPATVVDMVKPHFPALLDLAARLDGPLANDVLRLAANFADFTSWMTQEIGDDVTALRWLDDSAALAREANDDNVVAHSYVRRANMALYQQDAYATITFAKRAQGMRCGSRVKRLAALREAQGHALAGDFGEFSACVDRAVALPADREEQSHNGPLLGPTKIADPLDLARGWSLYDLGRSADAVEVLEPLLARTKKTDSRAWARTAARLALALAAVREIERACGLTKDILALPLVARSATIRSDLRQLSRMLNRWKSEPAVREIMPRLSAVLLPTSGSRSSLPLLLLGDDR